jgi:hypothetical protein
MWGVLSAVGWVDLSGVTKNVTSFLSKHSREIFVGNFVGFSLTAAGSLAGYLPPFASAICARQTPQ